MTQDEAARVALVSRATWWRWEEGRTAPPSWRQDGVRDAFAAERLAVVEARWEARHRPEAVQAERSEP